MALKALGAVWDWAGRADDIYGRLLILVSTAAVVGGGFLLLLRVVGVVDTLLAIIGGLAILLGGFFLVAYTTNAYAASSTFRSDTSSDEQPDVEPKVASAEQPRSGPRWEEAGELAAQSTKTSKAIYAFLDKHALRQDETKVVAEYRRKFDAKVLNLCLDIIAAGLSTNDGLQNAMKPPASVDDIQWIARVLAITGEAYSAERLAKYQAQAMKELALEGVGIDADAHREELEGLEELKPFVNAHPTLGSDMSGLAALERWMEGEGIPEPTRRRMRATTERLLKEMQELEGQKKQPSQDAP